VKRGPTRPVARVGRRPNTELNSSIAEVLRQFPSWRDEPEEMDKVCQELDKRKVPLPRSKKAKAEGWACWQDALDNDPEWVRKALQHRAPGD
jgi:hypothetical protein